MTSNFAELDFQRTPLGDLFLRRRRVISLGGEEIYEIKLGESFLMSSLFHEVEEAVARLGLAGLAGSGWRVAVGGLGLGYTAAAALEDPRVASLVVVDALAEVIGWHQRGMVPLGPRLTGDARCRFEHADFFARVAKGTLSESGQPWHAVLLDIDHSPRNLLHPVNGAFYKASGLRRLAEQLLPGGAFALWSDDPPDAPFLKTLREVFADARAEVVPFIHPLTGQDFSSTVYVAHRG